MKFIYDKIRKTPKAVFYPNFHTVQYCCIRAEKEEGKDCFELQVYRVCTWQCWKIKKRRKFL